MNIPAIKRMVQRGFRAHEAAFNAVARRDLGPSARQIVGDRVCADQHALAELLNADTKLELRDRLLATGWNAFCTISDEKIMLIHVVTPIPQGYRCVAKQLKAVMLDRRLLEIIPNSYGAQDQNVENEHTLDLTAWIANTRIEIPRDTIRKMAREVLPYLRHVPKDRVYYTVNESQIDQALHRNRVSENIYIPDEYDCEDFAEELKVGLTHLGITACGVVYDQSASHAYNILAEWNGCDFQATAIEPQTDKRVTIGTGEFLGRSGVVVW